MDTEKLIADLITSLEARIETCHLIMHRMVDHYVLADPENGHVLHTTGVRPFGQSLAEVECTRDKEKILRLQEHVRENNPDNSVAQRLKWMGWKKAARLQRQEAEDLLHYTKVQAGLT